MEGNAAAYDHDAPPTQAPTSGVAITALVLSIVLQCGSVFGVWWVNGVGMVLAVLAWPAIASGRRRGAGVAIAAAVIALAGALLSFFFAHALVAGFQQSYDALLATLERSDREKLKPSVLPGEDAETTVTRWTERFQKVRAEAGAYTGPATFSSSAWGTGPLVAMLTPPDDVEEVAGDGSATPGPGEAIWFQAAFEKATLWVAAEYGKAGKLDGELLSAVVTRGSEGHTAVTRELRYFRPRRAPPK